LIVSKLEQFDYAGAAVIGATMLLVSLALLLVVQIAERAVEKRMGGDPS
jgi:sulfate transport system permease protein